MFDGYRVVEKLFENQDSVIWRGQRQRDDLPVLLKCLHQDYPSPERVLRFRQEFEILRYLSRAGAGEGSQGVIAAQDWIRHRHSFCIVLEDFGGIALHSWLQSHPRRCSGLEVPEFLALAMPIAEALGQVHRHRIIHRNITPSNIAYNPVTGQLKLIDFGIASTLPQVPPVLPSLHRLEGTLAYLSPEQSGRMNRPVDYRTDFYSLGVTFYELLSGQLPFASTDVLEMLHSHLARPPRPLEQLRDLPAAIAAIVMKLLAKDPEHRYQSAAGLLADLERCRGGQFEAFELGLRDRSDRFHIPQRLYGREADVVQLLEAFERISPAGPAGPQPPTGRRELVLIAGETGIGKTALVGELYRPLTRQRGYLVAGKFDQFQRHVPYSAWIQALGALLHQLLTESAAAVQGWRDRLGAAVGSNGQLIVDILPDAALILGDQPPVEPLPPAEAQNRFRLVLQAFVGVFAQPEHPLVIFLDDLQWADHASLLLLESLLLATEPRSLLLLGAYRTEAVTSAHPLHSTLATLRARGQSVATLWLQPLDRPSLGQLVSDTLRCAPPQAEQLASIVQEKTGGHPFFVRELLTRWHTDGLISADPNGGWRWQEEHLRAWQVSDHVVELVAQRLHQLPLATQQTLQVAACIGSQFTLKTLALALGTSQAQLQQQLAPPIDQGILLALGETYPWVGSALPTLLASVTLEYRFAHDRVQQAAYSCPTDGNQAALHYRIGQLLWRHTPAAEQDGALFAIVNHLNAARPLIQPEPERVELARLNLRATRKAKDSAAYAAALDYATTGLDWLTPAGWEQHYPLALALGSEAAAAAYMGRDFARTEELVEAVKRHAALPIDQVEVYQVQVQALICQGQLPEAIRAGQELLELLGVALPEVPTEAEAAAALTDLQRQLAAIDIDALIDLPPLTAPRSLAILQMLTSLIAPAYNLRTTLFVLVVVEQVRLSVGEGNAALSCLGYALYGSILCGQGEIDLGYRFGQLALRLLDRLQARPLRASVTNFWVLFISHWQHPLASGLPTSLAMYRLGLETGDFVYGAYSAHVYCAYALCSGRELTRLAAEIETYNAALADMEQQAALQFNRIVQQSCLKLLGQAPNPCPLVDAAFEEDAALGDPSQGDTAEDNATAIALALMFRLYLAYLFRDYTGAEAAYQKAIPHLHGVGGMHYTAVFCCYSALTRLALLAAAGEQAQDRAAHLAAVVASQQQLQRWAVGAPANHGAKYHLVAAELARVQGQDGEAREHYDRAIALALHHDCLHEVALGNELAARFYLTKDLARVAQVYLQEAHYAYRRWGAAAKVRDLETQYCDFFTYPSGSISSPLFITRPEEQASAQSALDLASVVKASQAISQEIVLPRLLQTLLRLAIENAGAHQGFLILGPPDRLTVEIGYRVTQDSQQMEALLPTGALPLEEAGDYLPTAIVRYGARTHRDIVLGSAEAALAFAQDDYLLARQPRSVLCLPLLRGGQPFGLLYLENPLTTDSFTSDRVDVLRLLSAQAAISLENAQLYANLENTVADRTRQLQLALAELETLATTDKLTGAYNRRKFEELFDQEMNRARRFQHPLSLILLDIDHFKAINDAHGHLIGDRVLTTMADLIHSNIRNIDALIRWGGEEFLILAAETDLAPALALAEKLRQGVAHHRFPVVNAVTISLGVATFRPGDTLDSLTGRADQALYRAKQTGRNRVEAEAAPRSAPIAEDQGHCL